MKVRINLSNRLSPTLVWGLDSIMSTVSTLLSVLLLHMLLDLNIDSTQLSATLAISLVTSIIATRLFHTYEGIIRNASAVEMIRVLYAMSIKAVALIIVANLTLEYTGRFVYSIIGFDFVLSTALLMGVRVVVSSLYYSLLDFTDPSIQRALIFNTSEASVRVANYIRFCNTLYSLKGFISTNPNEKDKLLLNEHVYVAKNVNDFKEIFETGNINAILFAKNTDLRNEKDLVAYCLKNNINLQLVSFTQVENEEERIILHKVQIEDLLGREEIHIDMTQISAQMDGKTVMVTGAAGSIGSELCRQLYSLNLKQLVLFDFSETALYLIDMEIRDKHRATPFISILGDVRDRDRVESVLKKFRPDIIFHAAAYKHVPMMEMYPCEAVHTNVGGTVILADLAVKYDVKKFIMISSDKAVRPSNVMGATKRLAEMYVQSFGDFIKKEGKTGSTSFITTRFGNVLGSNGSIVPLFREQIRKGGPVTVTHPDVTRYFMTIPEACRLVLEASTIGKGDDIYVFDMGVPVKIADLASRMIELSGLKPCKDIEIKYIGLRPGEKLYEEVLYSKEDTTTTSNPKIFRAMRVSQDHRKILEAVDGLLEMAATNDSMETVRLLKQIVQEYKSEHSEFEKLD